MVKVVKIILVVGIVLLIFKRCETSFLYVSWYELGCGYAYDDEVKHITGGRSKSIPPRVISYNYSDSFIVVKQIPKEIEDAIYYYDSAGEYQPNAYIYPLGKDTTYYWIIIKPEHKVLGPLELSNFLDAKKLYNIKLDFKD